MELELSELLKGRSTLIKGKEYLSTEAYVTPFLERMSKYTNDFRVQVKLPDQITFTKEKDINVEDITFNRVWVQAVLPSEYSINGDNHQESINLLYALDTRKPVTKIFKNYLNMACLNMCVFNPHALEVQELSPNSPINYRFLNHIMELTDNTTSILNTLSNKILKKEEIFDTLGHWVDKCIKLKYNNGFGNVKLAESLPIEAYKNLFVDIESPYYCPDGETDYYNIYNAWTYPVSNDKGKDIVNKFEKHYLISEVLNLV